MEQNNLPQMDNEEKDRSWLPDPMPGHREKEQRKAKPVEQGMSPQTAGEALLAALICLAMGAVYIYSPVLNIIGELCYPVPLIWLIMRRGTAGGWIAALLSLVGGVLIFGLLNGVMIFARYGVLGLLLGYCFLKEKQPFSAFSGGILVAALSSILYLLASLFVSAMPLHSLLTDAEATAQQYQQLLTDSGLADSLAMQGINSQQITAEMAHTFIDILPAALIISAMVTAAFSYLIAIKLMRRLGYEIGKLPHFREWRLDWRFSWGLMLGLAAGLLGGHLDASWLGVLGDNLMYVFGTMLFVSFISFFLWLLHLRLFSIFFIILVAILLIICPAFIGIWFCIIVAVLDPLLDLRGKLTALKEKLTKEG